MRACQERRARGRRRTYEVDTDRRDVGFRVGVVGEPKEEARLSNTGITDEEELEEVVVSADGQQSGFRECRGRDVGVGGRHEGETLGQHVSTDPTGEPRGVGKG